MLYIMRMIALLILFSFVGIFGTLYSMLRPFNPANILPFARMIGFGLKLLGIKYQAQGLSNFHRTSPYVVISNHQHNFDVFPCGASVPYKTVSMGKKIIRWFPLFGQFYWLSGNVLIDRGNKKKAFNTIDQSVDALKKNGKNIWIMPEGTRNKGQGLKRFKKGAFYTAIKAEVPIIPVSISTYVKFVNVKKLKAGKVMMKVHEPVSTKGLTINDWEELATKCRKIIQDGIDELDAQIEKELGYNYKA